MPTSPDPDADAARAWLLSAEGSAALQAAGSAPRDADPVRAATALRRARPDLSPAQVTAVQEQVSLRALARDRYGLPAEGLLLTRDGLEQATRPVVARYRADLLRASGVRRVLDLTAGLGFDAAAFAAAGITVIAVERDPAVADFCRVNVPEATVITADATDPVVLRDLLYALAQTDAVFVDPARRDPGAARDVRTARARPERDPERWSPPWSFVEHLGHPRVAAKVSPSFRPPAGWPAVWSSVHRTVVECSAYSWPVFATPRRAAVHGPTGTLTLDAVDTELPVAPALGAWLVEVDPAIEAARVTTALRSFVPGLARVDPESTWLCCDVEPTPGLDGLARSFHVTTELAGSRTDMRRELRRRSIERLTVKSRDAASEPRQVLRDLGCTEGPGAVLILTRRDGRSISLLAEPAPPQST